MISRLYKPLLAALLLTAAFHNAEIFAMSIFKGEQVCIFSGFEGRLTYKGEPASGARIVRHVSWKDKKGVSDETVADKNGEFSFPSRWDTLAGLKNILPSEFVAHQNIYVYYNDEEIHIWTGGKRRKDEYAEFKGDPVFMHCELTDELESFDMARGFGLTSCKWNKDR